MKNIAIAGFQHETNTFSPDKARFADFVMEDGWPGLTEGEAIFTLFKDMNLPLAGFIETAQAASQWHLHPIVWASAEPCGLVEDDAFDIMTNKICQGIKAIEGLDGIYLDLHGAMVTESFRDGEGELLRRIRQLVGPDLPLVISLDLHANISPAMVEHCSAITVFRSYPHLDMAATGGRACELMQHIMQGKPLHKAMHQLPFLLPLTSQCTDVEPWLSIYQQLVDQPTLKSMDLALGFTPADTYDCGPCLLAYGDSQTDLEQAMAQMVTLLHEHKQAMHVPLPTAVKVAATAVIKAANSGKPVIIADVQDNPGGGGSADTTGVLRALLASGAMGAYVGVMNDPLVTQRAHEVGVGGRFKAALGGHNQLADDQPLNCELEVCFLADGHFLFTGEMYHGIEANVGPMALIKVIDEDSEVYVITSVNRIQLLDLGILRHVNVEPTKASIIAVKSSVHFRADFAPIASDIQIAASPGYLPCIVDEADYEYLRPSVRSS